MGNAFGLLLGSGARSDTTCLPHLPLLYHKGNLLQLARGAVVVPPCVPVPFLATRNRRMLRGAAGRSCACW
ncbi:hypothetical protein Anapl_09341 [Anas platyrhynchos]|uniref:Uncharacterized protein n=1 Tax=Anas platyrhynchos TaxID=8839 RepID=R0KDB2_ANAPL|nr:hypothetical protein Anapl_09341 [Anas platyrhynchos]